jgi:hypothetical protein
MRKGTQALLGSNLTAILTHEYTVSILEEALSKAFLFLTYWYSFMAEKTRSSNWVIRPVIQNVNYKNNLLSVVPSEKFPHFPVSVFIKGGRKLRKAVGLQVAQSGHPR